MKCDKCGMMVDGERRNLKLSLNHKVTPNMDMSAEPSRLTDDERKKLTRIPDNVETREVLETFCLRFSLVVIINTK